MAIFNQQVQDIQNMLLQLGYKLPIYGADGKYGAETKSAVLQFQKNIGLNPTGVVDSTTQTVIIEAYNNAKQEGTLVQPISKPIGQPLPSVMDKYGIPLPQPSGVDWKIIGLVAAIAVAIIFLLPKESEV